MTDEEKKAAEQKAAEDARVAAETAIDPIALKDEQIAKLQEERDNYKAVALKRLGKLPGDADFGKDNEGLSVAEQVRMALLDREIDLETKKKEEETRRIVKENAELRLALKNRPEQDSIGGGSGSESSVEVKDNVITDQQRVALTAQAQRLGADPEKFIASFKKNLTQRK